MICEKCNSNNVIVQAKKRRKTPYVLSSIIGVPILMISILNCMDLELAEAFLGVNVGFFLGALLAIVIAVIPFKLKSIGVCQNCGHIQNKK